jgi:hypothetical protein
LCHDILKYCICERVLAKHNGKTNIIYTSLAMYYECATIEKWVAFKDSENEKPINY